MHTDTFVHTGPGTVAGRYLRTFWQPVYRAKDLAPGHTAAIRIMSEDFTLFRGDGGAPHLVASRCAHRGTRLSAGWVEDDCIRCCYHGWRYEASGQCVEQPGEDEAFAAKVRIRSYPVQEYLGHIFAYLGEGEPPPFRRYPDFEKPYVLEAGPPEVWPCNYFSRLENDASHVVWVHSESTRRLGVVNRPVPDRVVAEETDYGMSVAVHAAGVEGRYVHYIMPNLTLNRSRTRVEGSAQDAQTLWADRLFWHVPIDDESNASFVVDLVHLTGEAAEAYRLRRRNAEEAPAAALNAMGEEVISGRLRIQDVDPSLSTYKLFWVEDYRSIVGQGSIPDRSEERLGRIDSHVILMRRLWLRELEALEHGRPLKQWAVREGIADMSPPPVKALS